MANMLSLSNCDSTEWAFEHSRRRAAIELAIAVATVLFLVWTDHRNILDPMSRTVLHFAATVVFVGLFALRPPTVAELGMRPTSWTAGVPLLAVFTVTAIGGMFLVGPTNPVHGDPNFSWPRWLAKNWHIDVVQQILLQWFVAERLRRCLRLGARQISLSAAIVFGCLHAPNLPLVAVTAVVGFGWCEWFRRFRNLPAVIISHMALATAAISLLGMSDLRVGIGYVLRRF